MFSKRKSCPKAVSKTNTENVLALASCLSLFFPSSRILLPLRRPASPSSISGADLSSSRYVSRVAPASRHEFNFVFDDYFLVLARYVGLEFAPPVSWKARRKSAIGVVLTNAFLRFTLCSGI